jgi:Flp pilus assembly CpaF family ATPase
MMNDLGGTGKDNEKNGAVALLPRRAASLAAGTSPSVSANATCEPAPVDVYADLAPCVREALADPATEDVIVDGSGTVRVVARGMSRIAGHMEEAAIRRFCLRAAAAAGRYFSAESPRVSAILPHAERLEAVHPAIAPDGAAFVLRRPGPVRSLADLEAGGVLTAAQRRVLAEAAGRRSVLVTGLTGSGKTTLIRALLAEPHVAEGRRIVAIETDPEVQRPENGVRMVVGEGASMRALLISALRLRPNLIVVGEVRDPEAAWCLVHAARTGHVGMSTVHAATAAWGPRQVGELTRLSGAPASRLDVALACQVVAHIGCDEAGRRKVEEIISACEGGESYETQPLA